MNAVKLQEQPCDDDEWLAEELAHEVSAMTMWFADGDSEIPDDAPQGPQVEVAFNVDKHIYIELFTTREHNGDLYVTDEEMEQHI